MEPRDRLLHGSTQKKRKRRHTFVFSRARQRGSTLKTRFKSWKENVSFSIRTYCSSEIPTLRFFFIFGLSRSTLYGSILSFLRAPLWYVARRSSYLLLFSHFMTSGLRSTDDGIHHSLSVCGGLTRIRNRGRILSAARVAGSSAADSRQIFQLVSYGVHPKRLWILASYKRSCYQRHCDVAPQGSCGRSSSFGGPACHVLPVLLSLRRTKPLACILSLVTLFT